MTCETNAASQGASSTHATTILTLNRLVRGGYRVFQKGGLRPAIRKAGGGGGCWPDTKSGGGGGGVAVLSGASGPIQKAGKGEGLFSRRGGVTIYERGGCNPQTPPPPRIRLY